MATVGPDVMVRETSHLIASDKVEGTPVRRSNEVIRSHVR